MKGRSLLWMNEKGYMFPFVLFASLLLFSTVGTTVLIYRNDLAVSDRLIEQMKAETLVQMSIRTFYREKPFLAKQHGTEVYQFPSGMVEIHYTPTEEGQFRLVLTVETDEGERFSMQKIVRLNDMHVEKMRITTEIVDTL